MRVISRLSLFLIVLILVFAACACFGNGNDSGSEPPPSPDESSTPEEVSDPTKGILEGFVYLASDKDKPVPAVNAELTLSDHLGCYYTEQDGSFRILGISEGEHKLTINDRGSVRSGLVTIVAGKKTHLTVEMSAPEEGSQAKSVKGSITVTTYPKQRWKGRQVGVTKILIQQYGNYRVRWWKDYSRSFIWQTYQWWQPGIPADRSYSVTVYWADGTCQEKIVTLNRRSPDTSIFIQGY